MEPVFGQIKEARGFRRFLMRGLEKVNIEGKTYFWVETESTNYKITKKGERKKQGDTAIVKALVEQEALDGDRSPRSQ